jgi:hypothetical protein
VTAVVVGFFAHPVAGQPALDYRTGSLAGDEPQAIYSADRGDAWNRIFAALFTRPVRLRLSEEFAGAAPFETVDVMGFPSLRVSTRTFGRIEGGDRAIEPLYPLEVHSSAQVAARLLNEPRFGQLARALNDALSEQAPRPPLARALLQCDLWAAHDVLAASAPADDAARARKEQLLGLLARSVKKLALDPREITGLPENYASAGLPFDLFAPDGGWMEVEYLSDRIHDYAAGLRRVARIFVKPAVPPQDLRTWLNGLPKEFGRFAAPQLAAVALVVQLLLVDADGVVVPTRLTYEVQVRRFRSDDGGALRQTKLAIAELSRKTLLLEHISGGLCQFDEHFPLYLPAAGNDYGFASSSGELPILVPLRKRCQSCHGQDLEIVLTFAVHHAQSPQPVRLLLTATNERAVDVARRKMERPDFQALKRRWSR